MLICKNSWRHQSEGKEVRSTIPAFAERQSADERPEAAVETDRGRQTEDGYDPEGFRRENSKHQIPVNTMSSVHPPAK